ncbi:MAG: DUF805 domain-containing protein [Pasteurellaceae bacterium]|nr:DUF805 domain-containing protein [Pasteurellaceae bacterium]
MNWYFEVLKKYATFTGRARRKEYWFFTLFNTIIVFLLAILDDTVGTFGAISLIYMLATFLPNLAVAIRRLHDTGRSGWWILICLLPVIGFIIFIIFMCMDSQTGNQLDSQTGSNKYGPNPKLLESAQSN